MSLRTLSDIKLPVGKSEKELITLAEKKLGKKVKYFEIKKKSLDARDKNALKYVYTIAFSDKEEKVEETQIEKLPAFKTPEKPVLIVGAGPAGLFCALRLLKRGIKPVLVERGATVEEREKDVGLFIDVKRLNQNSNVQFGEGGAGTFSDGKLNTQTHSPLNKEVLETFVKFGAPKEILWLQKPHIGSDNLKTVVKNMRQFLLSQGAEIHFHTKLSGLEIKNGTLVSVNLENVKTGEITTREVSALSLAIGHSARDTFESLLKAGVAMRAKDFAVGVRIEHLQEKIGLSQYGNAYSLLPAADYKLVSHASERAVFTFCMCPGGYVMPATSEENAVVTNGMSNYARNGKNANAALIAQVRAEEFENDSPLAGVEYQRKLERAAYIAGGNSYAAPVQRVEDFLRDRESGFFGEVLPTYPAGTCLCDLRAVLPKTVIEALKNALPDMEHRLRGFAHPDALLTAVETRTSSPVRILREEDSLQSVTVQNLYPCGEGAGYAGGITSSAADGIRVADAIYKHFC